MHELMVPEEQNIFTGHIFDDSFLAEIGATSISNIYDIINLNRVL